MAETPQARPADTGLVLFAGEDVWSSLQSLAWLQAQGGLGGVFLYQTADPRRSAGPAERLRRFCSRRWPGLRVVVPGEPGEATAAGVAARVREWRRFRPDLARWVLDATCATRAMLPGVADLLGADPACRAIYRETDGIWQALQPAGGGRLGAAPLQPPVPFDATDALPVAELVETLAADVAEVRLRESREPEALASADLAALVRQGTPCNWDWSRMYVAAFNRAPRGGEFTLQDFVVSALAAMGVRNARVDLKVVLAGARPVEAVLDLVVCRRGRVFVFDCRSRDEQRDPGPAVPQVALEGLWPVCVCLRQNRWATDAERALAAMAGRAHVVDANGCRRLFSWLGELMAARPPEELRGLEQAALRLAASRLPVFTPATQAQRLGDAVRVDEQVFDVVKGSRVEAGGGPTAWRAARVSPDLWFIEGRVARGGTGPELRDRLAARFSEQHLPATVLFFELAVNKKFWHALVRVAGDGAPFTKFLHKWKNMPLVV